MCAARRAGPTVASSDATKVAAANIPIVPQTTGKPLRTPSNAALF